MKTSKKLTIMGLSAATALVAATGAVSSFAWFAANSSVTATGMVVKANASDAFLQITTSAKEFNLIDSFNAAAAVNGEQTITPVQAYASLNAAGTNRKIMGGSAYAGAAPVWAYGHSNTVEDATLNSDGLTELSPISKEYALINDFQLRLRPGQGGDVTTAESLTIGVEWAVTPDAGDTLHNAVSVLVTNSGATVGQLFTNDGSTFSATEATKDIKVVQNLTSTQQGVKVYVFFNGENANCASKNVVTDRAYSVKITFSITK